MRGLSGGDGRVVSGVGGDGRAVRGMGDPGGVMGGLGDAGDVMSGVGDAGGAVSGPGEAGGTRGGLAGLDRPAAPTGAGAWDERSEEWLTADTVVRPDAADSPSASVSASASASASAGEDPTAAPRATRRGGADPVKALMHRHRDLCERAVDPLEIAAGLEAHGVTDRTAARFLHRDVFSLAEEMYARTSRDAEAPPSAGPLATPRARADWVVLTLLPGALCAAAVTGMHLTHGQNRLIAAAVGALAVTLALRAALARGPLSTQHVTPPTATRISWLLAYALLGDGLLQAAAAGGPDALPTGAAEGPWPLTAAPVLALALSCAPAAWCAHFLAVRARHKLSASRALKDFAASAKPLILATLALYLAALAALLALTSTALDEPAAYAPTLTLGALLFLARLLTTHGFTHAPALVLTAAASAEGTAVATVFAARLPGCAWLGTPAQALLDAGGPAAIPTIACGAGALTLLLHATRTLTRASAHARADDAC